MARQARQHIVTTGVLKEEILAQVGEALGAQRRSALPTVIERIVDQLAELRGEVLEALGG